MKKSDMHLLVLLALLPLVIVRADEYHPLPSHVVFLKFYKVGGTTVADVLGRLAQRDQHRICCGRRECEMCYMHSSLGIWKERGRRAFPPHAMVATLLRDPIEREISRYFYDRARGESRAKSLSLERWAMFVRNDYTSVLGRGDVGQANQTLESDFDIVGITERMDEFVVALGLLLRQSPRDMAYRSLKRVIGRPSREQVSRRALSILEQRLQPDRHVYEHALRLFDTRLAEWDSARRDAYRKEMESARPSEDCSYAEHKGALHLHGKDCLHVKP